MAKSYLIHCAPSPINGIGLFASQRLQCGHYIGTYEGPSAKRNGKYVLWVHDEAGRLEGRCGKNLLRYLNHSHKPNSAFEGFDLFALRTIKVGEEITFDYTCGEPDAENYFPII